MRPADPTARPQAGTTRPIAALASRPPGLTRCAGAAYTGRMADLEARLLDVLDRPQLAFGDAIGDDYTHDEALTGAAVRPLAVVSARIHRGSGRCRTHL